MPPKTCARNYSVAAVAELVRKRLASLGFSFAAPEGATVRDWPADKCNNDLDHERVVAGKAA